jgi:hypothetical protein
VKELLETKSIPPVDPMIEDMKKEQERIRSKSVYIDPEQLKAEKK